MLKMKGQFKATFGSYRIYQTGLNEFFIGFVPQGQKKIETKLYETTCFEEAINVLEQLQAAYK